MYGKDGKKGVVQMNEPPLRSYQEERLAVFTSQLEKSPIYISGGVEAEGDQPRDERRQGDADCGITMLRSAFLPSKKLVSRYFLALSPSSTRLLRGAGSKSPTVSYF